MNNETIQEIASSRRLWEERIDPDDNAPFDSLTQAEREEIIREIWPNDFDDDGNSIS